MTQTHTHVQGYSDRPGQAHLEKPLHGFIRCWLWCDGHSFEMPHVALIKITNKKHTTHPARHRMTVFIVVLGGFLFPWFSLTIQPLNGIEMSLKENTNFNWYWNIPGNKNEIVLQIPLYFMGIIGGFYLCLTLASISGYCVCMCSLINYSSISCHVWKKATSRSFGGHPSQSDSPSRPQRSGLPVSQALDRSHW